MRSPTELTIDVTAAACLGEPAHTAVTVYVPDAGGLADPPVICFGFPGGGYSRRYFAFDVPDGNGGGEAEYHCSRGWIFVACDHLGFGGSTVPEGNALDLDNVAAANHATVEAVMHRIEAGTLAEGLGPIRGGTRLAIGQSMGAGFTIVAQANLATFDGVGILGFSAIHTVVPSRPGQPPAAWPWISRRSSLDDPQILNAAALAAAEGERVGDGAALRNAAGDGEHPFQWAFHHDDEPADIVSRDMAAAADPTGSLPIWRSATTPPCGIYMVAPGAVVLEAASITVPVLIAVGERDVVPDPWAEPKAYQSAQDIGIFVCPGMAHMHNFALTRERLWQRIHSWGQGVAALRTVGR